MGKTSKMIRAMRQSQLDHAVRSVMKQPILYIFASSRLPYNHKLIDIIDIDNCKFEIDGSYLIAAVSDTSKPAALKVLIERDGLNAKWNGTEWLDVRRWCGYKKEWLQMNNRDIALGHMRKTMDTRRDLSLPLHWKV